MSLLRSALRKEAAVCVWGQCGDGGEMTPVWAPCQPLKCEMVTALCGDNGNRRYSCAMFRLSILVPVLLPISAYARRSIIIQNASNVQPTLRLQDKVALVTASTDGIGLAIARKLAQDGARVLISSRQQENVDRAVKQLKGEGLVVEGTVCHVGLSKDRENLVNTALEKFGGIDILVSNATAFAPDGGTLDPSEEKWDEILNVNIKAPIFLAKLVVPIMKERGGGSIVFIGSQAAYKYIPGLGPYIVAKTALLGLTKTLAPELWPLNIRVNGLVPGGIRTTGSSRVWKNKAELEKMLGILGAQRIGEPEECASVVSFLCSSEASYITGENIVVAGGGHSHL